MANQEQLGILRQGVEIWNEWRTENPSATIDLQGASFKEDDLNRVNLSGANLWKADFRRADLRLSDFSEAYLREARFWQADLYHAKFQTADLSYAELDEANLTESSLWETNLLEATLGGSNLSRTDFGRANFSSARLVGTDFSAALAYSTTFGNIDMSEIKGLDSVTHHSPSTIGTDTISKSKGKIPEVFLRGCGLSDWEIEAAKFHNPKLNNEGINKILYKIYDLRASQAIQISPLFISYSHGDSSFVEKLENQLNEKGIRFWRDIHDMKSGRIETQVDRAIRQNPTVLLILSEHSLKSDWVEHEVRTARGLEKELEHDVLCPVALDSSWKDSPWPKRVMEQVMEYNILDFSEWQDDGKFGSTFNKLIDGLGLFYKG